jgi:hypothetical protein
MKKKMYKYKVKAGSLFLTMILVLTMFAVFISSVSAVPSDDYEFGDWYLLGSNINEQDAPILFKNGTNDYWYRYGQGSADKFVTSENNQDYLLQPEEYSKTGYGGGLTHNLNMVSYNNKIYMYHKSSVTSGDFKRWQILCFDGSSWSSTNLGVFHSEQGYYYSYNHGAKMFYYNGQWYALMARANDQYITFFSIDDPSDTSPSTVSNLDNGGNRFRYYSGASHAIFNGTLFLFYRDPGGGTNIRFNTYDGISLSSQQSIEHSGVAISDCITGRMGENTYENVGGLGVTVDYEHYQLFMSYVDTDGNLVYRLSDDPANNNWSDKTVVANISSGYDGKVIQHCQPFFIDGRMLIGFSSNAHTSSTYKNYYIASPSYTDIESGATDKFNTFSWDDASPGDTNINSSVFILNNTHTRDIETITWHVGDIGDISSASNVKIWSNMSGSWSSYQIGVDQNTSTIDISAVTGGEWTSGMKTYWKFEILVIDAGIDETSHIVNYDMYYWVDLTPE